LLEIFARMLYHSHNMQAMLLFAYGLRHYVHSTVVKPFCKMAKWEANYGNNDILNRASTWQ